MPRRKINKPTSIKRSPIALTFLLVKFILIQLGNLPINIIKFILQILRSFSAQSGKLLRSIKLSTGNKHKKNKKVIVAQQITKPSLSTTFSLLSSKRGRPRKDPFYIYYPKRIRYFFKHRIPKRYKVGAAFAIFLLIFMSYTTFLLSAAYQLPSPEKLTTTAQPLTTEIFDRNGKLLYRLYEGRDRILTKLEDMSPHLINATIAIEDKNFYNHPGIDVLAIIRAVNNNLNNEKTEGASTITQQLIKNTLLTSERTLTRKIKEAILSVWAETIYSKPEILAMYLNESPYGGVLWGVEAASEAYFDKKAKDLTLGEAAFIAGLPGSPTEYSPYSSTPELGKQRQKEVLSRMAEEGYITKEEAEVASNEELNIKDNINSIKAGHFVNYVREYLANRYGPRTVSQGGLKIYTTLDLGLQEQVEQIVSQEIDALTALNVKNGAAMITDARTGQILAMIGSRGYKYPGYGNFNVTTALRQPGSSIKPLTYITAFKKGYTPGNTILDTPVNFRDEWGNSYAPVNYDGKFHGAVSIRTALGSSYNTTAVKLLATVGIDEMVQTSRDLGITTFTDPKSYGLSLTLGGAGVKMVDMMGAYGTFAQNGVHHTSTPIIKVTDSAGNILEEYSDEGEIVLQPELAYLINSILSDNNARTPAFGPNSLLNLPNVAVKTGTTDLKRDNWTFGYSQDFVVGVWVGNNDNTPMNPSLTSGVTGAAPIWNKIMKGLLAEKPATAFIRPPGIIESIVDGRKDLAVSGILPKGLVRAQYGKDETKFFDAFSSYATSSATAARKDVVN